jgi:hypothetical protein
MCKTNPIFSPIFSALIGQTVHRSENDSARGARLRKSRQVARISFALDVLDHRRPFHLMGNWPPRHLSRPYLRIEESSL